MADDPSVPAEWSGIWSFTDTVYTCAGMFQSTDSDTDTLCTGMGFDPEDADTPAVMVCSGTVTPTTVDITCNGSYEVFPDCLATILVETTATRTNDSYTAESIINITTSGTGTGCDLFPPTCMRIVTHATRIAGEPTAYCATQIEPTTWGSIKSTYR
jgi:hypothetical protein